MSELIELIGFLDDTNVKIRQHALDLVQGLTGSPEGLSLLSSRCNDLVPPLLKSAGSGPASTSKSALVSLVNLSQETEIQNKLLELNATARCMDYLKEGVCAGHEDMLIMLLANLTANERGSEALLQLHSDGLEGLNVSVLLRKFIEAKSLGKDGQDRFEHVATILPNITRFQSGRQLVLESGRGTLAALVSQLRSKSSLRRRGCSGAIKNCFLSCEEDGTLAAIIDDSEVLSDILAVLADTDVDLEKDDIVRENLADSILSLAKISESRKKLWELNAPELLRKGYEYEEHPGTCEAMESAASLFLEDGFETEGQGVEVQNSARPDVHIEEID